MTALLSLDRDLLVRRGAIQYQFNRFLDGRSRMQLENLSTGEYLTLSTEDFVSQIRTEVFVPVLAGRNPRPFEPAAICDLTQLPLKVREQVDLGTSLIRSLKKLGISRGQRRLISRAVPKMMERVNSQRAKEGKPLIVVPGASLVMKWWRALEDAGGNAAGLIGRSAFRTRRRELGEKVEDLIDWALDTIYLQPTRPTLKYTYGCLRARLAAEVKAGALTTQEASVSMATLQRRKAEIDPHQIAKRRYGAGHAKSFYRGTVEGSTAKQALERVEVDHTLLNWVVVCDRTGLPLGRPTLTIVVDSYSHYVVGLYVSFNGPSITSVLNAIKSSILPKDSVAQAAGCVKPWIAFGVADCFVLDNGMEFHSNAFKAVQWELSTDIVYCGVRMPWLKPHVERTFADLDLIPVGEGRVRKPGIVGIPINPYDCAVITLSKLCQGLVLFACDLHGHQVNRQTLATPYELFQDSLLTCPPPTMPTSTAGLDLIAANSKTLMLSNGGVEMKGLTYAGPRLRELLLAGDGKHRTLVKWNPENLGFMHVRNQATKEWIELACTRPDYAIGLTENQHNLIRKVMRAEANSGDSVDHMIRTMERLVEMWREPLARKNADIEPKDVRQFARFSASAAPSEVRSCAPSAIFVAEEDLAYQSSDIPDFEAVVLPRGG